MTRPATQADPTVLGEDWIRVEIPMPVFDDGPRQWQPVGWLNSNNLPDTVRKKIIWDEAKALWRRAAYNAYVRARVPTGVDRIEVRIEFRFLENHDQEPSNYEFTVKPIIDALQPLKSYPQKKRKGGTRLVIELGAGVIPRDSQRHLVRGPELPVGAPLGKNSRVKGMVIVHIRPLPVEVSST